MINLLLFSPVVAYELIFINQLNMAFDFDHNIFLLHSSMDISQFVGSSSRVNSISRCVYTIGNNLNESRGIFDSIRAGKIELLIACPGRADFESIINLMLLVKRVQALNVNVKIALFLSQVVSSHQFETLFRWCWDHRIVNIFVAFRQPNASSSLNVFGFSPFGTFELINRTECITGNETNVRQAFPGKISNVWQHAFRIAVIGDYSITQYSSAVESDGGPDEILWTTALSVLNGTFSIFRVKGSLDPVEVLDNGTVDIHGDLTDLLNQRTVTIYPMVMEILSIVVPKTRPYPAFDAFVKMVTTSNLVGYTFLIIGVGVLVLMSCRYIKEKKCMIVECVVDVINLLLNDNMGISYQQMSLSENCLAIPMTFAGFIIANGFLSSLKSQLTRPIMQPQIETIEDFYYSPLPMTSPNDYWLAKDAELLNSLLKYGNFSHKMRTIKYPDFVRQITDEAQFSFAEHNSVAKFMCKHKSYHITPIQMQRIWYTYNTRPDFPYVERFNEIIQRVTTAGLYEKWWRDATPEDKLFQTAGTGTHADQFSIPFFIVYGWVIGLIVFVIEISWKIIKNKLKRKRDETVE